VVFECAGFLPAISEGITDLRQGGTYVEMGHFVDVGTIELNPNQMLMRKNLRLEAIWGYGGNELFIRAVAILSRNEFPFAELVDPILPLERAADGFRRQAYAVHSGGWGAGENCRYRPGSRPAAVHVDVRRGDYSSLRFSGCRL
jgi:threonine dehydrogenase-like Zn-dependent dehydrogenase